MTENPFISVSQLDKTEYLTYRCSLNRAILQKVPVSGVENNLEGKSFSEIFSTMTIVDEIRRVSRYYAIDLSGYPDFALPKMLDDALFAKDVRYRQMAHRIVSQFGNRLGLLLLTLRTGLPENRAARDDWDDDCWNFWRDINTVILTGGLASSMLGRRFKEHIYSVFDRAGVKPYQIMLFDNGSYLGVMGLAQRLMADDTASLVLDLGHTSFKRAVVKKKNGEISGFLPFDTLPSRYMKSRFDDDGELLAYAYDLHNYIVNIVSSTYKEALLNNELSDHILISIANYTHSGILHPTRGGFAKLSRLGESYRSILEEELSGELRRDIKVSLVHDGTATALYFSDIPDSVCITIGTGFGVGFPQIKI